MEQLEHCGVLECCVLGLRSGGGTILPRRAVVSLEGERKTMSLTRRKQPKGKPQKQDNKETASNVTSSRKVKEIELEGHPNSLLFDVIDYFGQSSIDVELFTKFLGKKRRVGSFKLPLADAVLRKERIIERPLAPVTTQQQQQQQQQQQKEKGQTLQQGGPARVSVASWTKEHAPQQQLSPTAVCGAGTCIPWRKRKLTKGAAVHGKSKTDMGIDECDRRSKGTGASRGDGMAPMSTTTTASRMPVASGGSAGLNEAKGSSTTKDTQITATTASTTTSSATLHTPIPSARWNVRWYALGGSSGSASASSAGTSTYVRLALRFVPLPVPAGGVSGGGSGSGSSGCSTLGGGGGGAGGVGGDLAGCEAKRADGVEEQAEGEEDEEAELGHLHLNARRGHVRMVTALLDLSGRAYPKANYLDMRCKNQMTPLDHAIMAGQLQTVKTLCNSYGRMVARGIANGKPTPVHAAVRANDLATLKIVTSALKHHKALISVSDAADTSHSASSSFASPASSSPATPWMNILDHHGDTALSLACKRAPSSSSTSSSSTTAFPLSSSSHPSSFTLPVSSLSALSSTVAASASTGGGWASSSSSCHGDVNEGVVQYLIKMGAGVAVRDSAGRTPLMNAAMYGNDRAVCVLLASPPKTKRKEFGFVALGRLAAMACEPCGKDANGQTAMFLAAANGHEAVIHSLAKAGVPFRTVDKNQSTPLHAAASGGHLACVMTLVQLLQAPPPTTASPRKQMYGSVSGLSGSGGGGGSGLSASGGGGGSAAAATTTFDNSAFECSTILLDGGPCTVNSMDCFGRTPAALALSNGHDAVYDYLTSKTGDLKKPMITYNDGDDDVTEGEDGLGWGDEDDEYIYECAESEGEAENEEEGQADGKEEEEEEEEGGEDNETVRNEGEHDDEDGGPQPQHDYVDV